MKIESFYYALARLDEGDLIAFRDKKLWIRQEDNLYSSESIKSLDDIEPNMQIQILPAGSFSKHGDIIDGYKLEWQKYLPKVIQPQQSLNSKLEGESLKI